MALSDEFDTGLLDDDGSTTGFSFDDLDQLSPGTNLGFDGLQLDPSVTDNQELDPETWGGGTTISDPSIRDQMALSGVTDPPPSPDASYTASSGSGTAAPQAGAGKATSNATGLFASFSKFGAGLGQLFSGSDQSKTRLVTAPSQVKPSTGAALAAVAILVLLLVVISFGGER